jgi:hypothetical protein
VAARRVVVDLEVGKFAFEIMGIPEQREGVKHLTDLRFGSHSKWQRSAGS